MGKYKGNPKDISHCITVATLFLFIEIGGSESEKVGDNTQCSYIVIISEIEESLSDGYDGYHEEDLEGGP